jgi:hypothetical protein
MNKLETEFLSEVDSLSSKIKNKLKIAERALKDAEQLAEEAGIPFIYYVSYFDNLYIPKTFSHEKWKDLSESKDIKRIFYEFGDFADFQFGAGGWQKSSATGSCGY